MNIEELIKIYSYDSIYDVYIKQNTSQKEAPELLGVSPWDFRKLLTFYNIKKDLKLASKNNHYRRTHEESVLIGKKSSATQKKNWCHKTQEEKDEWIKLCRNAQLNMSEEKKKLKVQKAINTNNLKTPQEKDIINKKRSYSCKKVWEKPETHIKYKETFNSNRIKRNGRLCRSLIEQNIYDKLLLEYEDLIYDTIVDDRYPYNCDFYIPSIDLFIEIQGHPSHGKVPYGYNSDSDIIASQLTNNWLDTYINRDVKKLNTALKNNINYIRLYPNATLEENYDINQNKFKDIVKLLYESKN